MYRLAIEDDEGTRNVVPIARSEIVIGRKVGSTIRLTARNVSRAHARLVREDDILFLLDDSRYGTWLNGRRASDREPVFPGDAIRIADYELTILRDAEDEEGALLPPTEVEGRDEDRHPIIEERPEEEHDDVSMMLPDDRSRWLVPLIAFLLAGLAALLFWYVRPPGAPAIPDKPLAPPRPVARPAVHTPTRAPKPPTPALSDTAPGEPTERMVERFCQLWAERAEASARFMRGDYRARFPPGTFRPQGAFVPLVDTG